MEYRSLLLILFAVILLSSMAAQAKFEKRYDSQDEYDALGVKRDKRNTDGLPDDIPADVRQQLKMQMEANKMMQEGKKKLEGGRPDKPRYSTQMGGACYFACPNGKSHPLPSKPNHKPKFDGCGITGMPISGMNWNEEGFDFRQCCNIHDKCYNRCNQQKEDCDTRFKQCMMKWCKVAYGAPDDNEAAASSDMLVKCEKKAQIIHSTTSMVGCTQYKNGQEDACDCADDARRVTKYANRYEDYDDESEDGDSKEEL